MLPWAHLSPIPNISTGSAIFVQLTAQCRYTLQWAAPFPIQIIPLHGGSGLPSNTMPWAHLSPQPKWHLNRFSRFWRAH